MCNINFLLMFVLVMFILFRSPDLKAAEREARRYQRSLQREAPSAQEPPQEHPREREGSESSEDDVRVIDYQEWRAGRREASESVDRGGLEISFDDLQAANTLLAMVKAAAERTRNEQRKEELEVIEVEGGVVEVEGRIYIIYAHPYCKCDDRITTDNS